MCMCIYAYTSHFINYNRQPHLTSIHIKFTYCYNKCQATQIVRAVGQTFDVCHRKTLATMAEQEKVKRSIKEENKLRKDKCGQLL